MILQIIISAQAWLISLCVLAGLIYAALLYYREFRYEFSLNRRIFMGVLRGVAVAFIAFFLLSPFFRSVTRKVESPIVIVAQDQSASLVAIADSAFYKNEYPLLMDATVEAIDRNFDVHTYAFGNNFREGIDFDFSDKQTDISEVLLEVQSRYQNRNVGALILASDGIFNHGIHPNYVLQYLPFPVYTIALGDTVPRRDAAIVNVAHNRIAYLNNSFPLEIHLRGVLLDGSSSTLRVLKDGELLFTERITFTGNNDNKFVPVELNADKAGLQRYRVEILPVGDETLTSNNVRDVFIEVLESRQRILVLFGSPHPDITAIRQTLESQRNYEVVTDEASLFTGNPKEYGLVILHQVPSRRQAYSSLIRKIHDADVPVLHILGSGSDLNVFNTLGYGFTIEGSSNRTDEILPAANEAFSLFTLSNEFNEVLRFFPPLFSPAGTYRGSIAGNVLFYRQIGSLKTDAPLVFFNEISGRKTGIIAGEGIWRWRLANFARRGNHDAFNELLTKSIQYLALRERKERFMVQAKNTWDENETIEFSAEFYNESFEPITIPEIEMVISDEAGNNYPFAFSRSRNMYSLRVGSLPPGNYLYAASTRWNQESYEVRGAFSVLPLQMEYTNTVADHRLLHSLAQRFGGEMFFPSDMQNLPEILAQREDMRPVFYLEKSYLELIDVKWLLAVLLFLLTAEWIIRRLAGGY